MLPISSVTPLIGYAILTELVGKWFSKQTVVSNDNSSSGHNDVNDISCSLNDAGYILPLWKVRRLQ